MSVEGAHEGMKIMGNGSPVVPFIFQMVAWSFGTPNALSFHNIHYANAMPISRSRAKPAARNASAAIPPTDLCNWGR